MKIQRKLGQVAFIEEMGRWIAQHVELDLVAEGATKEEALRDLMRAVSVQAEIAIEHDAPYNLFKNNMTPDDIAGFADGELVEVCGCECIVCVHPYAAKK